MNKKEFADLAQRGGIEAVFIKNESPRGYSVYVDAGEQRGALRKDDGTKLIYVCYSGAVKAVRAAGWQWGVLA